MRDYIMILGGFSLFLIFYCFMYLFIFNTPIGGGDLYVAMICSLSASLLVWVKTISS